MARCFPGDSEKHPARAVSLNFKGIVAILHVRVAGEPTATVSAKPAEKPFLNFSACGAACRCLPSFAPLDGT